MAQEQTSPYLEGTYQNAFIEKQSEFLASLGFNYPRSPFVLNQKLFPNPKLKSWRREHGNPHKTYVTGFRPEFVETYRQTSQGLNVKVELVETYEVFQNEWGQGYDEIAGGVSLWDIGLLIEPRKEPRKPRRPLVPIAGKNPLGVYKYFEARPEKREKNSVQAGDVFNLPFTRYKNQLHCKREIPPQPRLSFTATVNPHLTLSFVYSLIQTKAHVCTFAPRHRHVVGHIATKDLVSLVDLENGSPSLTRSFPGLVQIEIDLGMPRIKPLKLLGLEYELEEARASLSPAFSRRAEREYIERASRKKPEHII